MMKRLFKLGLMTIVSLIAWSCAQDDSTRDLAVSELAVATEANQFSEVESLQRSALAALYESTGGANWLRNDNWNTNAPLSEWYGLKVEDGYVTSIDLSDNNLTGVLPGELVQLGKIQSIILSGNKIGGQIPAAWGVGASTRSDAGYDDEESYEDGVDEDFGDSDANYDLDAILAQLSAIADDGEVEIEDTTPFISSLAVLDLSDNLITGTLPEELGNLNKLRSLSIKGNLMKGEISMALQQSAMWQSLSVVPVLEQKQNNVLTIASSSASNKVTSVQLDKSSLSLTVGQRYTFTPTITPSNADVKAIKWKTGNKAIVAINTSGTIKGVSAGTANIAVYVYNQDGTYVTAKCKVTVTEDVPATAVSLNESTYSLNVGEKFTLRATTTPTNATPTKVVWKSGNESVVKISNGVIEGVGAGKANVAVYVYNADGTKVAALCKVTVTDNVPATAVELNTTAVTLEVGERFTLSPTITPLNATPTKVTWKSGNTNIVKVSNGVIKGIGVGKANVGVYVYNEDGSKVTAICKVTVKDPNVPATAVELNTSEVTLEVGEKYTFTTTITPADATPTKVVWKSGNESIVRVGNGAIRGLKPGTANVGVYVYNEDGSVKVAKCKVTVKDPIVPATAVELDKTEVSLEVGERLRLTPTITPTNATPSKVVWKSGNTSVVEVSDGVIKGIGAGTANVGVYVYNEDGTVVVAKCKVTVKDPAIPATAVELDTKEITLNVGEKYTFTTTIIPANATPKEIKWRTGDESIVRVGTGAIRGLKPGTANVGVYVYNVDGTVVVAKCKVTVLSTYNGNTEDFNGSGEFDNWDN